jgi:glycosyltransferase involved in cell wall biosynthesis
MELDVLMPFHRIDSYLRLAVNSLSSSEKINFRLIAIDDRIDQSTDVSDLFHGIKDLELVKTSGGKGYGNALKTGTQFIQSDACALMNSDDLVNPQRFFRQLNSLNRVELSITKMQRINEKNKPIPNLTGRILSSKYDPILLLFGSYGADASWCMRTSWWKEYSFFDQGECLDWRMGLKVFSSTKIDMINETLYYYRKHDQQVTSNKSTSPKNMDIVYEAWKTLAINYEFNGNTRSIFDFIATPWSFNISAKFDEVAKWTEQIKKLESKIDPEILTNIKFLIHRRKLFGFKSAQNSTLDRLKFGASGIIAGPKLIADLYSIARS